MREGAGGARRSGARTAGSSFLDGVRAFDAFGTPTLQVSVEGIPYLTNEYWTARQRQAHSIHEVSYRACFKPQLPEFFIARLTERGEGVHDPFMGRGTTPVQAGLMGRTPMGSDVNPLSLLLTRPRLRGPAMEDVAAALERVPWQRPVELREDLLAFYHVETLRELTVLREWLLDEAPPSLAEPHLAADWIRMVALNRLTGHSAGFFSVYTLPPNQAVSVAAQLKINAKRGQVPPRRNVRELILRKSRALLADGAPPACLKPVLATGPAHRTPQIADACVALVVTSPPFLNVVQYADDNWLRCWFAGIDLSGLSIAMHGNEAAWTAMVRDVLREQARIVRPGGHVAFEVGEVRGGRVLLERLVWQAAEGLPFERLVVMVNSQEFTKTANCWGVSNNKSGTNSNRIVLLQRH